MELTLFETWAILAGAVLAGAFAWYQGHRERPLGEVSLMPWTTILILCVVLAMLMVVHLVNVAGVETGRRSF